MALVIGNAEYKVGPLQNPVNDAAAVAEALERQLKFDKVILKRNLGFEGFRAALSEMARESAGAEVAAVFFAGHGTERDGRNYLIPVDAKLDRASDLDLQAIALSIVLDQIAGATKLKLVILDACRNNVFPLSGVRRSVTRGLARIEPEDNTLVVYAAKEGTTADDGPAASHSPFTAALLNHIATPGLEVSFVFRRARDDVARATGNKQQPHLYGTLGGEAIYLKGGHLDASAEAEVARKAIEAASARLAEEQRKTEAERRLLEEERRKLALAAPPVPTPSAPVKQAAPAVAMPTSEPLPAEVPISPDVLRLVETHPFFANAPPVRIGSFDVDSTRFSDGGNVIQQREALRWLRQGLVRSDSHFAMSGSKYQTGTLRVEIARSTWSSVSVEAANGLISLGSKRVDRTRGATTNSTSRTLRLDKLSGSVFPVKLGNRFSYQITGNQKAPTYNLTDTTRFSCEVTKQHEARSFHADLAGQAYLLVCDEQPIAPAGQARQSRTFFFENLGVWIAADPILPAEQVIDDATQSGTHVLKSFKLAR